MKKLLCAVLVAVLLFAAVPAAASADGPTKEETKKSIAIVFDNSSSMYVGTQPQVWCRATYAMEVFASMMSDRDEMAIYPMHPITIGKGGRDTYSKENPLKLKGSKDAQKIRDIYTPDAGGTPIETIDAAYNGLMQMDGERWLIILTDGTYFNKYTKEESKRQLEIKLSDYIGQVNIMYLGIGNNPVMPEVSGSHLYYSDKATDSRTVLSKLSNMCNNIFGRDTMEIGGDGSVDIGDLSMRKMIFLVQGKEISNVAVTDGSGHEIGRKTDERAMKYSTNGSDQGNDVDRDLQGMMVTYEGCAAGTYTLRCSGTPDSIVAYYEPDVDLVVQLLDANGNRIMGNEEAHAGRFTLSYGLYDNRTGKLTESALLGNTEYTVTYTVNGKETTVTCNDKKGQTSVELKSGDVLTARITATYLSGYTVTKNGPDFGWPADGFHILPEVTPSPTPEPTPAPTPTPTPTPIPPIDPSKLVVTVSGGQSEYRLAALEAEGHYFFSAAFDGRPLNAGEFRPNVSLTGGNAQYEMHAAADGSGYDVLLKYNGDAKQTSAGDYRLVCSASYTDEFGQSCDAQAERPFTVRAEEHWLTVDVTAKQTYYQISKLETGEPVVAHVTKDGAALSDEQMRALELAIDTDGVAYETNILPGESAIEIRLKRSDDLKTGVHHIRVSAKGADEIGQEMYAEDRVTIEIQKLPAWVRWAIIAAAILLLALLIFLFLNQKVLPKSVKCNGEADFNIGGKTIEDNAKLQYNRSGKQMDLSAPAAPMYPYVSCAAKLKLEPVSPRRVASAKRRIAVKEVTASNDITSVEVGASVYELDKVTGKFVKEGNSPTIISNNSVISINGTAQTPNGRKKTAILSQQLRFK